MNFYYLILIPLSIAIICTIVLSGSYSEHQCDMLEEDDEEGLEASHSRFQKITYNLGAIAFLFTIVHSTLAVAMWLKELM